MACGTWMEAIRENGEWLARLGQTPLSGRSVYSSWFSEDEFCWKTYVVGSMNDKLPFAIKNNGFEACTPLLSFVLMCNLCHERGEADGEVAPPWIQTPRRA